MHESEEEVTDMKLPYYFYWLKMPLQLHLKDYSLKSIKKKKKSEGEYIFSTFITVNFILACVLATLLTIANWKSKMLFQMTQHNDIFLLTFIVNIKHIFKSEIHNYCFTVFFLWRKPVVGK